tara:strand:- start:689 stop:1078 length:390 start_codon:yes stop_codon:yes gene_type:complete
MVRIKKRNGIINKINVFIFKKTMTKDYDNDKFNILRAIGNKPGKSQRQLSKDLDLSLGKINYCIKALREKGLIKIGNFSKNPKKLNYIYLLTPKGISNKTKLTINFMQRKMKEYDELKKELEKAKQEKN